MSRFGKTSPFKDTLARYIEMDFAEITTKKAMAIRKSKELSSHLGNPDSIKLSKCFPKILLHNLIQLCIAQGGTSLRSPVYNLVPCDLRKLPSESFSPLTESSEPLLRQDLPTLLVFECVLVYMNAEASNSLLEWFRDYFKSTAPLGCTVYEMFGLGDQFGKVLIDNLKVIDSVFLLSQSINTELSQLRNVHLPGATSYPTKASLPKRFLDLSFSHSHALTLKDIRHSHVPSKEIQR